MKNYLRNSKVLVSSLIISTFILLSLKTNAQVTVWSEDFEGNNSGDQISTGVNPNQWYRDLNGVNISGDWFEVRSGGGNEYFEARDIDGTVYWYSQSIDISYYTNVSVTIDGIENGPCENQDYIQFHYRLNGGAWTRFTTNWRMRGNFSARTASVNGLVGTSLELRVSFRNNENNEYHRIDNVLIQGIRNTCTAGADEIWREDFESGSPKGTVTSQGSGTMLVATYPRDNSGGNGMVGVSTDAIGVWTSNSIDISGSSDVYVSVDYGSWFDQGTNSMEDADYIEMQYSLNGGTYTAFTVNDREINDVTPRIACVGPLNGNTLNIRTRMRNTANDEHHYIDNIIVSGTDSNNLPPVIAATGDQGFCDGDPALNVVQSISISDPDDIQLDAMSVQISSGYENTEDVLSIIGSHPNITSSWDVTTGRLTLTGPATFADFESAISSVQYSNTSGTPTYGARIFSITLEQANFLSESNHFYEFIADVGIRWDDARDAAAARTYYGLQGYLATLSSQAESDLAGAQISGAGWLGGSDEDVEGVWKWMTGPEVGTVFWNGLAGGSSPSWAFWNTGEPNNVGSGGEDYAHITDNSVGIPGSWNDLPIAGGGGAYQPKGYVVEYGGTTGDPVLQISATTSITVGITPIPVGLFHD